MLIYRCFAIILDRKIKYVVLTIAFCIVVSVCTLISVVAYKHVEMFRLISVRDFKSLTGVIHYMTQLNLAQIVLYTAVTVSTTGLIFQYVGRCLMNNKGYYEYLRSCRSSRMAVIFILDQLFNLIFTAMVSSSRYQIRRSYFHYQNFSLSLAAYFFYWTFEDIKNAVRQTGMASKSMPSVPNETGNQDDSELPASAKVNKQNDSRNKV